MDDVPLNLQVLQDILSTFGLTAVMAASGVEALDQLRHETFDVVLMDILMPEMDGLEVFRHLRAADGPSQHTPVIALSADAVSRSREAYLALGFADFLAVPISIPDLLNSLLRATREIAPTASVSFARRRY